MPIYEYIAKDPKKSCDYCKNGFEKLEPITGLPSTICPQCGNKIHRQISAPNVGASQSGYDDRAKGAGFHKLRKVSKGEYEQEY
ncbi:FmdB family zinc ribbon protein [Verrucomicrobiota bacterium]